ncbi:hypothetical protein, partial [Corynebacterium sp.]|uniref:hypothetical protein n=1 Tax=Corynebacterium sp. TaxID=1720 RepID=UPI0026DD5F6D
MRDLPVRDLPGLMAVSNVPEADSTRAVFAQDESDSAAKQVASGQADPTGRQIVRGKPILWGRQVVRRRSKRGATSGRWTNTPVALGAVNKPV